MATKDVSTLQVLMAYKEYGNEGYRWPTDYLMFKTGEPEKVCYNAMKRECDRDLIDYGVSLRGGWLTEKGKAQLAKLTAHP